MILEQIRRRGVVDQRVLAAIESVPRHFFVPDDLQGESYMDAPLPIGFGQTISKPYIVGLMTASLQLQGGERVLEVGTGSGYQAAILGALAAEVHTIELIPELAEQAEHRLSQLNCRNVHVHCGDGSLGWPHAAPYAAILVAAAAASVPPPLTRQLADNGRLVVPLEDQPGHQLLMLFTRRGEETHEQVLASVTFVPLRGCFGLRVPD
jgi:protein-L-isoaspartate(D-aspartate) O-methyltransferase